MSDPQRRNPRVRVQASLAEAFAGLGAQVTWPNLELSSVLDLSYSGLAARRPGVFPVAVQNFIEIEVQLGAGLPFNVRARIAWCNEEAVGLEFKDLPSRGHQAMTEYLDLKLVGSQLRPVERAFFSAGQEFTHWYQGPGNVHVFVWMSADGAEIHRVDVELLDVGGRALHFERGRRPQAFTKDQLKALLILSQMDKPDLPMEDFVRTLAPGV